MSFGLTLKTLPDAYKRLLAPEDRKALGEHGLLSEEIIARGRVKLERDLKKLVLSLLTLHGIVPIHSRMDQATTTEVGLPDILFAVENLTAGVAPRVYACAWELKLPGEKLDEAQRKMAARMIKAPNAWRWTIITSVDDAIAALREAGIE